MTSTVSSGMLSDTPTAPESREPETTRLPPPATRSGERVKSKSRTTSKERLEALTHGRKAVLCVDSVTAGSKSFTKCGSIARHTTQSSITAINSNTALGSFS